MVRSTCSPFVHVRLGRKQPSTDSSRSIEPEKAAHAQRGAAPDGGRQFKYRSRVQEIVKEPGFSGRK